MLLKTRSGGREGTDAQESLVYRRLMEALALSKERAAGAA
jgi:hypothetical protein